MPSKATDSVHYYLKEIGRYPMLTIEEEVGYAKQVQEMIALEKQLEAIALRPELAILLDKSKEEIQLIQQRGKAAKERMATANLRLVVMIAKKYQNRNMEFIDLIQEGSLGLYRSIEKFDPSKGYKFSTYAYWWIRQGITRAIAEKSRAVRLPFNLTEKLNKIKKIQRELSQSLGRSPTIIEIAQASNLSESKIVEYLKYSKSPVSLNLCVGKDEESELGDLLQGNEISLDEQVDQQILRENLISLLSSLTVMQQQVLVLRYGINSGEELSLDQVGEQLKFSRERIRQIQNEAIRSLKKRYDDIR
jgi:RNA polymerase nonessential primary-like sigma factor